MKGWESCQLGNKTRRLKMGHGAKMCSGGLGAAAIERPCGHRCGGAFGSGAATTSRSGRRQSSKELRGAWDELSADATDRVGGTGCQATCLPVANAIEAALVGQKAIENDRLVLESVIHTCEVFLFGSENVLLIDCGSRKTVSIARVRAALRPRWVRCSSKSRAVWRWLLCGGQYAVCAAVWCRCVRG